MYLRRLAPFCLWLLAVGFIAADALAAPDITWKQAYVTAVTDYEGGDWAQALRNGKAALDRAEKVYGRNSLNAAKCHVLLGDLYASRGKFVSAEVHYARSLKLFEKALGPNQSCAVKPLIALANLGLEKGAADKAETLYTKALAACGSPSLGDSPSAVYALLGLASVCERSGVPGQCEGYLNRVVEIFHRYYKYDPSLAVEAVKAQCALGDIRIREGRKAMALACYNKALATFENINPSQSSLLESTLTRLAYARRLAGSAALARTADNRASAMKRGMVPDTTLTVAKR